MVEELQTTVIMYVSPLVCIITHSV